MDFLIITGLSGAGKSRAAEYLEDAGYYTVDNIPPDFIPKFAEFCMHTSGRYEHVALVSDVRSGDSFEPLLNALDTMTAMDCKYQLLFMEADLPTIIKRYKETRRMHPLAKEGQSLEAAADRERKLLQPVRDRATYVLDTTKFVSSSMLQSALRKIFGNGKLDTGVSVNIMSFGYKYGVPLEADIVMDVRFLPNPYYVAELKEQTGKDEGIVNYLKGYPITFAFLNKMQELLCFLLPNYEENGKSQLTVAFGCTGGRHRSVAIASIMTKMLKEEGYHVTEYHRDMTRN